MAHCPGQREKPLGRFEARARIPSWLGSIRPNRKPDIRKQLHQKPSTRIACKPGGVHIRNRYCAGYSHRQKSGAMPVGYCALHEPHELRALRGEKYFLLYKIVLSPISTSRISASPVRCAAIILFPVARQCSHPRATASFNGARSPVSTHA